MPRERSLEVYIRQNANHGEFMISLGQIFGNISAVCSVTWVSAVICGRVFDFHRAYLVILDKQQKEKWLLAQCEQDEFYHKLAYHSDLCEQITANAQISPTLYALNESLGNMKMCGLYHCSDLVSMILQGGTPVLICIVLLYIVTPSFILPVLSKSYESWSCRAFENRCSPYRKHSEEDTEYVYKARGMFDPKNAPRSDAILEQRVKYV